MLGVEEEEYCYIPMGGELPDLAQRIVGFGGAANMVHPATGAVICSTVYTVTTDENNAAECRYTVMRQYIFTAVLCTTMAPYVM